MRDVIIYSRMEGYSVNCVSRRLAKLAPQAKGSAKDKS